MGSSIDHEEIYLSGLCSSTELHLNLSNGSPFTRARASPRAQRLGARGIRRSDNALQSLSVSRAVSRISHDEQATTSQCRALAPCFHCICCGPVPSRASRFSPRPLGRLATLSASPSLASSVAHTNHHRSFSSIRGEAAC